jgi:aminopeptidase S
MKKGTKPLAALAAIAASAALAAPAPAAPPVDTSPLQAAVKVGNDSTGIRRHLKALQLIADANGGNRASPGPGYDASVDYVAGVLRAAGFVVTTPSVTLQSGDDAGTEVRNVVAQTRTGNPGRVVLAGAHLDSVPDGPGVNDNGSGVAALLEAAVRMGASPPVANAVRFGFWAAEERDFDGSAGYVDSLSRADLDALALYLNVDMVASPNAGYFVQGGAGAAGSDDAGPPGSEVVGRVLAEELAAAGVQAEPLAFDGSSDYSPFVDAGVPAGGVLAGDEDRKTSREAELWGGQAGTDFDPCYHSACDRAEQIDHVALDRFGDAIAGTAARFAESPEAFTR